MNYTHVMLESSTWEGGGQCSVPSGCFPAEAGAQRQKAFCAAFQHPCTSTSFLDIKRQWVAAESAEAWFLLESSFLFPLSKQCTSKAAAALGVQFSLAPGRHSWSRACSPTPPQHLTSTSFPLLCCFLLLIVGCYRETGVREAKSGSRRWSTV